jgi:four helix bundle protein
LIQDHKELEVWKQSVALTTELYKLTARFPDTERYGMISQIRRASISIPANIAEGWGRGSRGEYIQFLTIARGSLMELETHLIIACNLHLLDSEKFDLVMPSVHDIEKMLNRLIKELREGLKGKGEGRRDKVHKTRVPEPASHVLTSESIVSATALGVVLTETLVPKVDLGIANPEPLVPCPESLVPKSASRVPKSVPRTAV